MNWREHISIDAARMHGTPCLRGTRVPVYEYPSLKPEHIPAALAFAAELAHERVVPIPA